MQFSLMHFSSATSSLKSLYDLIFESAIFADKSNFKRIWLPERHFSQFGYLHPNPSVLAAALARDTSNIRLAAGSVVLPLHHPFRVAEEWAVVDNISNGRVDISFASGWHPNDFAFAPKQYDKRNKVMWKKISDVQKLWSGGEITAISGVNEKINVRTYPRAIQNTLPIWITAARSSETFCMAGKNGYNILTYLVDLGIDNLSKCINDYKSARLKNGFDPNSGEITVMLHTYMGADENNVKDEAYECYCQYLSTKIKLAETSRIISTKSSEPLKLLTEEDRRAFLKYKFDQVFNNLSLMGAANKCSKLIRNLSRIGVTEVACLIDFISDHNKVMESLSFVNKLQHETQEL